MTRLSPGWAGHRWRRAPAPSLRWPLRPRWRRRPPALDAASAGPSHRRAARQRASRRRSSPERPAASAAVCRPAPRVAQPPTRRPVPPCRLSALDPAVRHPAVPRPAAPRAAARPPAAAQTEVSQTEVWRTEVWRTAVAQTAVRRGAGGARAATSAALAGRAAGSFAVSWATSAATGPGTLEGSGGSARREYASVTCTAVPVNGSVPARHSYATMPSAYRSQAGLPGEPDMRSGAR